MIFGSRTFTYHFANLAVWLFMLLSASVFLESMLAGRARPLEAGPEWTCERLAEPGPYKQDQSGRVSGLRHSAGQRRLSLNVTS